MTDSTTTTTNLRLVKVSEDYDGWPVRFTEDKRQEFFAVAHTTNGFSRLLLPEERAVANGFYSDPLDPEGTRGWNINNRHLTDVPSPEDPAPAATPEAVAPEVTPTPWEPQRGDRVRVVAVPDGQWGAPADVVRVGALGEYRQVDALDPNRHHLLRFENGSEWWVKEVGPYMPETPEELDALLASVRAAATSDEAIREARRQARREANEEFDRWKAHANEVAIEYANNNSLCSEFDRCMLAIGLEPRDSYSREWEVTVTYSYSVSARDEEAAQEAMQDAISNGYANEDWEYEEL